MAEYLLPLDSPLPLEGDDLEDAVQGAVAGITGLDPTLVRPRFQPNAPALPDFHVEWAAVGLSRTSPDAFAFVRQLDAETAELQRDCRVEMLASFYGPRGNAVANRFVDGLQIEANRFALKAAGIKVNWTGDVMSAPAFVKERWTKRFDVNVHLSYRTFRRYKQAAIDKLDSYLDNEHYLTPIATRKP
jgi:hypothetical protein